MIIQLIGAYMSVFVTVMMGIMIMIHWKRTDIPGMRHLRYYFILAAITDLLMVVYHQMVINNMLLGNLFIIARFPPLALAFVHWALVKERQRAGTLIVTFISVVFAIIVLTGDLGKMNSVVLSIQNLLCSILAVLVLFRLTGDYSRFLTENYRFWFSLGFFLYFSVSTLMFATSNIILDNHVALGSYTWIINSVMSVVANLLSVKGILCLPVTKK